MSERFAMSNSILTIAGECQQPQSLSFDELAGLPVEHQVADVSRLVPGRKGDAVRLAGILQLPSGR
jgi:hypothetical protein